MLAIGRDQAADFIQSLGYTVTRTYHFQMRDERTPSALINLDGSIHDFGSGWHGDLIDFLKDNHGMSFNDAKKAILGESDLPKPVNRQQFIKPVNSNPIEEKFIRIFCQSAKKHSGRYLKELAKLFMGKVNGQVRMVCSLGSARKIALKYQIGFVEKSERLIMPIRDEQGKAMTFWKYKRDGEDLEDDDGNIIKHRKVLFSKDRFRPPFALNDLKEFKKTPGPIFLTEGEKDCLCALANGYRAVCIGGTGFRKLPEAYLTLFEGGEFIVAGDYDEAGEKFNKRVTDQLQPVAKSISSLDWDAKAKIENIKLFEKFDLADYLATRNQK